MAQFDNDDALTAAIVGEMTGIIDVVAKKLLEKLKEKIEEIVYDGHRPVEYNRLRENGGFKGIWDKTKANASGNIVTSEIDQDPMKMDLDQDEDHSVHGSTYHGMVWDIRDSLAEMLIRGQSGKPKIGSRFNFAKVNWWIDGRDYWTPFVVMLNDGTADKMIEDEFKARGIPYKKI